MLLKPDNNLKLIVDRTLDYSPMVETYYANELKFWKLIATCLLHLVSLQLQLFLIYVGTLVE